MEVAFPQIIVCAQPATLALIVRFGLAKEFLPITRVSVPVLYKETAYQWIIANVKMDIMETIVRFGLAMEH